MKFILKSVSVFVLLVLGNAVIAKPEFSYKLPLPGGTLGNTKLQYDTLMPVYLVAESKVPNCPQYSVTDTKVLKEPYGLKRKNGAYVDGKWEEIWTVSACNKEVHVPIQYILNQTGTTWAVSEKDAKVSDK